jgi:hypothetical protein
MDRLEFVHLILSLVNIGTNNSHIRESEKQVITLVREEQRHAGRCVRSTAERELSEREELSPLVLVICTIYADVPLEGLIHMFSLSVGLRVMARRKMHGLVEKFAQCTEKGGNEFHALAGSDVGRNTVFGGDMDKEEPGELCRGDMLVAGE